MLLINSFSVFAVTAIFYSYRWHSQRIADKEQRLRQRVAYMLWVMANGGGGAEA